MPISVTAPTPFSAAAVQVLLEGEAFPVAFVATDSQSPLIFATPADAQLAGYDGVTAYCGPVLYGGRWGIRISVYMPNDPGPTPWLLLTLMQVGAQTYAPPIKYAP